MLKFSPLTIAVDQGNLYFCKYMIEKTKDLNLNSEKGKTLLKVAAKKGRKDIYELLTNGISDKNPADKNGDTPLHDAAEVGSLEMCKFLIENVDDKNPSTYYGCTPLHLAVMNGHLEIVRLIIKTGVNKSPIFEGKTPLDFVRNKSCYCFYSLLNASFKHVLRRVFVHLYFTFSVWMTSFCIVFTSLVIIGC